MSESLGFENSGEVLMLNPERLSVYFRGPVSPDLRTSLSSMESIQDTLELEPQGCKIEYPDKVAHELNTPDYATDVAPIIIENCVACHNQGGVGPFAFDSYVMVLGWSPMIREVLMNKRMPPMQVDPDIGHSDNARYLPTKELQTLVHWIDAGAPRGLSATDPLENFEPANEDRWVLGNQITLSRQKVTMCPQQEFSTMYTIESICRLWRINGCERLNIKLEILQFYTI